MKRRRGSSLFILVLASYIPNLYAEDDNLDFDVEAGIVISSEYGDLLDDAYPGADITGGNGWLVLGAGVQWHVDKQFSVTPGVSWMFNGVEDNLGNSYTNSIILPKVTARYQFSPTLPLYVAANINTNIPSTGSKAYDLNSGGIGYGAGVGFAFSKYAKLELGIENIPVEAKFTSGKTTDYNLGGVYIKYNGNF